MVNENICKIFVYFLNLVQCALSNNAFRQIPFNIQHILASKQNLYHLKSLLVCFCCLGRQLCSSNRGKYLTYVVHKTIVPIGNVVLLD